jgi:hypothetical protein
MHFLQLQHIMSLELIHFTLRRLLWHTLALQVFTPPLLQAITPSIPCLFTEGSRTMLCNPNILDEKICDENIWY